MPSRVEFSVLQLLKAAFDSAIPNHARVTLDSFYLHTPLREAGVEDKRQA